MKIKDITLIITIFSAAVLSTAIIYNVVSYFILDIEALSYLSLSDYVPPIIGTICIFILSSLLSFIAIHKDIDNYGGDTRLISEFAKGIQSMFKTWKILFHILILYISIVTLYVCVKRYIRYGYYEVDMPIFMFYLICGFLFTIYSGDIYGYIMPKGIRKEASKLILYNYVDLDHILYQWFLVTLILVMTAITRSSMIKYSTTEQKGAIVHLVDNTEISKIIISNSDKYIICWDWNNGKAIIIPREKVSYIEK
jgi:hypothetical protein